MMVRLALLPLAPVPIPSIHDEFSYLLAADTFVHGRLTNPAHPFWRHFESIHILQQPTYMSMYPPAQGLFLALGKVLFGHPWFGLCLIFVLLGMAVYWALRAWVPPAWALPGALLFGADFGIADYWINSYWGGATATLGGFLVVGSAGRLLNRPDGARLRNALLLGLGVLILANTRPWEGLIFCAGAGGLACARLFARHRRQSVVLLRRWLAVVLLVLTLGGAIMGYYCWRITGNALQFPYLLYRRTYGIAALFFWQKPLPAPHYNHEVMRRFYVDWEPGLQVDSRPFLPKMFVTRLQYIGRAAINSSKNRLARIPVLPLLLLVLWSGWRSRNTRWLVYLCGFFYAGLCCQNYCLFHYVAPLVGAGTVLKITAARRWSLTCSRIGAPVGIGALYLLVLTLLVWNSHRLVDSVPKPDTFGMRRESLRRSLQKIPGRHLVIVHYSPEHSEQSEWVYNEADIDRAKVVWARDMGPERNQALRWYFGDRQAWWLDPERHAGRVVPLGNSVLAPE
jgi:hypothetical protein